VLYEWALMIHTPSVLGYRSKMLQYEQSIEPSTLFQFKRHVRAFGKGRHVPLLTKAPPHEDIKWRWGRVQLKCDCTRYAREEKWRGNKRMEWVTSKRHDCRAQGLHEQYKTLQADVHSSPASSRLNWRPRRFKWTRPFHWKTKSGFCACAITFQTQSTASSVMRLGTGCWRVVNFVAPPLHIRQWVKCPRYALVEDCVAIRDVMDVLIIKPTRCPNFSNLFLE
jgi:hypothetical protein